MRRRGAEISAAETFKQAREPSLLNHPVKKLDELCRIQVDLGRLGGLVKHWLTNDERTAKFGEAILLAVLAEVHDTQLEMLRVIRQLVQPRTSR
jgi:hypothetical protein